MNTEITNDFLDFLLKNMFSGVGVPPEYLSYSEQTEFARSLGMMNGKFVRSVIVMQKRFGRQFSKLIRLLYKNEYLNDEYKYIVDGKTFFILDDLEVRFPAPQALNMTTLTEQINASKDIVEFITSTLVDENDSELSAKFRSVLAQDFIPNLDWKRYNQLLFKAKLDKTKAGLEKPAEDNNGGY